MESKEHLERSLKEQATTLSGKWEYIKTTKDIKDKRVNPPYRPYSRGNPSQVIFRYGIHSCRG
jgi:hypothetical protein